MNKSNAGLASRAILAAIVVVALIVTVSAQTRRVIPIIQKEKQIKMNMVTGLPESAMNISGPGPVNPYPGQLKYEPLTIRVSQPQRPGMPLMVSVTKLTGEPFNYLDALGTVQIYSPYYHLMKSEQGVGTVTFHYGTARVHMEASASIQGSTMLLFLDCHRNDPDILPNAQIERRPFLLIVTYREPNGTVERGEAMVMLEGAIETQ